MIVNGNYSKQIFFSMETLTNYWTFYYGLQTSAPDNLKISVIIIIIIVVVVVVVVVVAAVVVVTIVIIIIVVFIIILFLVSITYICTNNLSTNKKLIKVSNWSSGMILLRYSCNVSLPLELKIYWIICSEKLFSKFNL